MYIAWACFRNVAFQGMCTLPHEISFSFKKTMVDLHTGPSCSKLTTSLFKVSLKFQTLILQIHCYALQRILTFFQQKITVYLLLLLIFAEQMYVLTISLS